MPPGPVPPAASSSGPPAPIRNAPGSQPFYQNLNPQLLQQLFSAFQRSQGNAQRANSGVQPGGAPGAGPTYSRLVPQRSNNFFNQLLPMLPRLIPQVMSMYKAVRTDPGMLKKYPQLAEAPSANLANPLSQPSPSGTP